MPYTELLGWFDYFERRPLGWQEDDRTYKLLQAQGVKAKPEAIFPSLARLYRNKQEAEPGKIDETFKKSFIFHQMLSASGGDKLEL